MTADKTPGAPVFAEGIDQYLKVVSALSAGAKAAATVEGSRLVFRTYSDAMAAGPNEALTCRNWYLSCPGREIALRIYRPKDAGDGPKPTLIFFHGGGWVLGDLETHDSQVAEIAMLADIQVVSVQYRRAPENRHPAAIEDGQEVFQWALQNAGDFGIDPARIAVGGDSAGGFVAASLCHRLRRLGLPKPFMQLLIYPAIAPDFTTASYHDNADMPLMKAADMKGFWACYLPFDDDGACLPDMPGTARDLSGLPPALIVAAEYDPLRDDALGYAKNLGAAGVSVELMQVPGMLHGFLRARSLSSPAAHAFRTMCKSLSRSLGGQTGPAANKR